ncbi:MAG: DUF2847 family protein [Spirochaetaceae bacterium]|nr:DUF2847 family protein [Spirochaetaceae bacterium]
MANIIPLETEELAADCYVYKHSTACPISAAAADVVRGYSFDLPLYWVNVIEQRPLSNWVADTYGVRHQSPQLLKISGGRVEQQWSHFSITPAKLAAS